MRPLKYALIVMVGIASLAGPGVRAQGPVAAFHTIGDLPGGPTFSTVRDATKVGGVIYAVGGSVKGNLSCSPQTNCQPDTAILWTFDGSNSALTALPNLVVNTGGLSPIVASAITPDAVYIASQARDQATGQTRVAVRVTTNGLTNLALPFPPGSVQPSAAGAISGDGSILYGGVMVTTAQGNVNRAARFDINTATSSLIALLNAGDTTNGIASRGTSLDGSVVVGFSAGGPGTAHAYRYVHGIGVSAIPRLAGGTFNRAVALSPDGNLTLVSGNSTALPNGGTYVYDTTLPAAPVVTKLGSPNSAWTPLSTGGTTADGSAVVVTYFAPNTDSRRSYLHNSGGWLLLASVLAGGGLDVASLPLTQLVVNGISPDGTLVYGQGRRDTPGGPVLDGFVAEFPAGFLANFDVPPTPPANPAIVGAWYAADVSAGAIADPTTANPVILVFLADGTYFHIEANHPASEIGGANGFERGRYRWDAPTGASSGAFSITTLLDTNGDIGLADLSGMSGATIDVAGDTLTIAIAGCNPVPDPEECSFSATRVTGGSLQPLVGAWFGGDPLVEDSSVLLVLLGNGDYYFAQDGSSEPAPVGDPNGHDGIEKGTWAWNSVTGAFSSATTVDTNGQWGLNYTFPLVVPPGTPNPNDVLAVTLSPDGLSFDADAGTESFRFLRAAVVTAPTPTGTNVVVEPTAPAGSTPVTIQFDTVTSGGQTTLQMIDPATVPLAQAPPAGFTLGDPPLYYEIDTTATFTGPVTVCFNYGGVTFASGTPRLLHYDEDLQSWIDITTSVDAATSTICGLTSSFSPFAIATSEVVSSGFDAPINPAGSYQNVVKGGSTVPLKFTVAVDGVEKTDTSGLTFSAVQVGCTADTGETPVLFETTGGTGLRYAGGQFVQNWQTPTTPGCYFVKVTGDGLLLSAVFRVK
jgi:hypothetical protein